LPLVMSSASLATSSPVKDRGGGSGRVVDRAFERFGLDRAIRA
jgi:hypothetical protein